MSDTTHHKLMLTEDSKQIIKEHQAEVDIWIKALRSGIYPQVRETMLHPKIPNSCCCLMVAEVACNGLVWGEWKSKRTEHCILQLYEGIPLFPKDLIAGLEWPASLRAKTAIGLTTSPDYWNDNLDLTFTQIADLLETGEVYYEYE